MAPTPIHYKAQAMLNRFACYLSLTLVLALVTVGCDVQFKNTPSDDVVVKGADFKNGLLIITMERIVPDEKKARNIPIGESDSKGEKVFLSEETK